MLKVEHIGIAVKSLTESVPLFEKLLNSQCYKTEVVASENVATAFFQKGETKIELLESTSADGVIAKYIDKKSEGFILLNEEPKNGADNKLVCFLHPKSTNSVLIELCQEKK
jgi:methylmalonyl-CoA/ethylmalonyl-CoA epimerase